MKWNVILSLIACSVMVLGADESLNQSAQKELAKFQGQWKFTSFVVDGVPKPASEYQDYKVFFEGNLWTVYENGQIAAQSTFLPDPKHKPKSLDIHLKLEEGKTRLIRGIYKFKKDTLTICDRGEEKGDRPVKFKSTPGTGFVLVTLQKVP